MWWEFGRGWGSFWRMIRVRNAEDSVWSLPTIPHSALALSPRLPVSPDAVSPILSCPAAIPCWEKVRDVETLLTLLLPFSPSPRDSCSRLVTARPLVGLSTSSPEASQRDSLATLLQPSCFLSPSICNLRPLAPPHAGRFWRRSTMQGPQTPHPPPQVSPITQPFPSFMFSVCERPPPPKKVGPYVFPNLPRFPQESPLFASSVKPTPRHRRYECVSAIKL